MTNNHCSEEELQLYAAEQLMPETGSMEHIKTCAFCQQQLAAHRLIISGIKEQPAASFDFDLEAAVLQQLQPIKTKAPGYQLYTIAAVVLIALLVVASLYFFRVNFINLSAAIPYSFMAISVVMCLCIIGLRVLKLYQRYSIQIKKLNFSE